MKRFGKKSGLFSLLVCMTVAALLVLDSQKVEASFADQEGTKQVQGESSDTEDYGDGYVDGEVEEKPKPKPKVIKITKISFSKSKLSGKVGEKIKLKPVIKPSNATNKTLSYTSSNKKVATVNSKGVVTLKKKGTVTITCKAKDGTKKKAKIKITVKKAVTLSSFSARTAAPAFSSKYYFSSGNIYYNYDQYAPTRKSFEGNKYCIGNCTWYACGRAWEILDKAKKNPDLTIFGGNPYGIWLKNQQTKIYKTGKTPKVGALVVFGLKYGSYHIAVVEKIDGDKIYVSESAYKTKLGKPSASDIAFHYGSIEEWSRNREIIGYIYLLDE
ncbi:MAG: CHAP domain-containing protein [Lachnospiraceae bacterium]|nr:CHAP domain-containing protein [Lachnospiraceae bacterium]